MSQLAYDTRMSPTRLEKLSQLCRMLPLSIASSLLLALIVVMVLWNVTGPAVMLLWFTALCSCSAWRLSHWYRHRRLTSVGFDAREPKHLTQMRRVRRDLLLSCSITGLIWGSIAFLLYPPGNMVLQLFVIFVLAGVTAGSAISLATDRVFALTFQLPALLPLAGRLLLQQDTVHVSMGVMVVIYATFIVVSVHWVSRHITENIVLRLQALNREQALQNSESRYRQLALHDALTGLPNRHALQSALSQRLTEAREKGARLMLIYLDVDNFKDVNDSRGHGCGDALLVEVAQRLRRHASPEDVVVRVGGDEFVFVRMAVSDREAADAFASQLTGSLTQPWVFEGEPINVYVSAGVSNYPEDGVDPDMLLKHADIALYEAKARGRNNYQVFAAEMRESLQERTSLERALAEAIRSGQLSVEYQPVVELTERRIIGLEALARWHHPDRGSISPRTFIPIAEQYGLIDAVGQHILRLVCTQLREWTRDKVPLVPISINVSPRQFDRGRIPELIATVSAEFELDPKLLQIEITETALMRRATHHRDTLESIRSLGAKVYFGTSYSSFSYVKHMPIDGLKIDRSFVQDMCNDPRDAAVIGAVIGIGRSLGITVVAEGIESTEQAKQLVAMGCSAAQGYYFYRPLAGARCREILEQFGRHYTWTETVRRRVLQRLRAAPAEQPLDRRYG